MCALRGWRTLSVVLLAAGFFVPGHATATSSVPTLASVEAVAEQIRHLKPLKSVPAQFPGDRAFDDVVKAELVRDNPSRELDLTQKELVLLGELKKTDSFRTIVFSGLTAQIIGLYDYRKHVLYVRNHNNGAFGVDRYNIAHEFTHALQDQYYHLSKFMPDQSALAYRNSDAVGARHALTEGDAVNVQNLYILKTYSRAEIQKLIAESSSANPGPPLPKAIKRQFYFPYTTGAAFVDRLYKAGGMAAVDAAYHRPPASTFEIMHPAAYLSGWKPVPVALHALSGFSDWTRVDDDVFGAFGYNVLLWQSMSHAAANKITDAYRGDRYIYLEKGADHVMVFKSVWNGHAAAVAARKALVKALRSRYPHAQVSGANEVSVTEPDGGVFFTVSGSRLTMAYGSSAQVAHAGGTASSS